MAYNIVAQRDHDASSHFTNSPPMSLREFYQNTTSRRSSLGLVPQSPRSAVRSREGSGSMPLRHPTPDLQSLQGAYVKNIERLEQSAERLSMSSDMGEELRKMKMEQRRSESRGSSILGQIEGRDRTPSGSRHISHGYGSHASDSIVSTNNMARSGGYSPAAYFASPRSSIRSGTWSHNSVKGRSGSQVSRLAQLSTSEQDNRPIESLSSGNYVPVTTQSDNTTKGLRMTSFESDLDDVEVPRPLNISPHKQQDATVDSPDRPATAASSDTYQQANTLFNDFDGVHIAPRPPTPPELKELKGLFSDETASLRLNLPGADKAKSFAEPPPKENLVYYPAPVPMMLNLPQRLSKLPSVPHREKRRADVLGGLPANTRKSAPWLANVPEGDDEETRLLEDDPSPHGQHGNRRTMTELPPQLRASVFFDYPAIQQDVKVKGESAIATLDSILDASAFAPVSAFTDHPIAGRVGAQIYSNSTAKLYSGSTPVETMNHRKKSSPNLLRKRNSASDLLQGPKTRNSSLLSLGAHLGKRKSSGRLVSDPISLDEAGAANLQSEEMPLHYLDDEQTGRAGEDLADGDVEFRYAQDEFDAGSENGRNGELDQYSGQPTTLLAELQLRKQQQKQRNRTAATAFPDGMHSTLLELDAVAQVQRQSRKHKHVTLAWEDPSAHHPGIENEDDEDVPLGMLFPRGKLHLHDRAGRLDEDRPLGLIAKREMEDNEPLSHRRARLRGEDPSPNRRASMYTLDVPGLADAKELEESIEIEGETLGQRRQRLRNQHQTKTAQARPISGDFTSEVMSQFGGLPPTDPPPTDSLSPVADPVTNPSASKTPDLEEETLGQRRKRLQAEREEKSRTASAEVQPTKPPLTKRRSMADLLQAHPAAGARAVSNGPQTQWTQNQQRASTNYIAMASRLGMLDPANRTSVAEAGVQGLPLPYATTTGPAALYTNSMAYNPPVSYGMTGLQMGQAPMELDPRQRDMINRWRQSVMH